MPYPDIANPDLLSRIPLSAARVLDVGCNTGALGRDYQKRNPGAQFYGIEQDPVAAGIAAARLHDVAVSDIEAPGTPFGESRFDCIIYGDVLEHLRDPWAVLRRHTAWLNQDGIMLVCIPNVEHWSFAQRLLTGGFRYEPHGLFDVTHLRWFSLNTMLDALRRAGLHVQDVAARVFDAEQAEAFANTIAPALNALGVDRSAYLSHARPLQYVLRACLNPPARLRIAATMLAPVGGISEVRVREPLRALATLPGVETLIAHNQEIPLVHEEIPRILILHRPLLKNAEGLAYIRNCLSQDTVIVCEFDDHPDFIPVLQDGIIQNFRAVHAVQTSTEALADVLRRDNAEIAVFPNAISELPEIRNFRDPAKLRLFFGGINREADWPPYIAALNHAAAQLGDRLAFEIVHDRGMFDALQTPHKKFTPLCDYDTYKSLLGSCELCFIPLQDTPFNHCKSDLKFIEAASYRVTALASHIAYAETVAHGSRGFVFHNNDELRDLLFHLVENPAIARQAADAARQYVQRHRMAAHQVARRAAWYRSLWARRADLTAALLARVPELATR